MMSVPISDSELLRRYAAEQSNDAFAELVRRHIDSVYAAALRQVAGDTHLARDVTQIVFTDLARKAGAVASHPVLGGWLHTSARFAATRLIRAEKRRRARERVATTLNDVNRDSLGAVDWGRVQPLLDEVVGCLKPRERDAIVLRFFEGHGIAEVGARLLLTEAAARSCLDRALDRMAALLGKRGVTSTGVALALALEQQVAVSAPVGVAASVTHAALTSGASAAGGAGLLAFMSSTKVIVGIAAGITVAAIWSAVHEYAKANQMSEAVAAVRIERDTLSARLATTSGQRGKSSPIVASMGVSDATTGSSTASALDDTARRSAAWQVTSPINYALDHPEARQAFIDQEVLRAKAHLARFFAQERLSPAEQAAIEKQLGSYAEAALEYYATMRAQGFGPMNPPQDPKTLMELLRMDYDVTKSFNDGVRQIIGDQRAAKFDEYVRAVPAYNLSDEFASRLYATETPLSDRQARQLVQLVQENSGGGASDGSQETIAGKPLSSYRIDEVKVLANLANGAVIMPGRFVFTAPITDSAISRAEAVLSPPQLATLRDMQAQQAAAYQLVPPNPKGATSEEALALYRKTGGH